MAGAADSEALMSPFLAFGLLALLDARESRAKWALAGGASLAVAALFKPPVILYGIAAVLAVLFVRGRRAAWTSAWAGAVGGLVVLGVAAVHLAATHDLDGAWICNVDVNRIYMGHGRIVNLAARCSKLLEVMTHEKAPWIAALGGFAIAAFRPDTFGEPRTARRWAAGGAMVLATGLYIVTLGGYFFHHYWMMVHPVLAVAVAAGWMGLFDGRTRSVLAWTARGVVVAFVAVLWLSDQRVDKRHLLRDLRDDRFGAPKMTAVVDAVGRRSTAEQPIWIWGWNPQLYVAARRVPATRFVTCGGILWGSLLYEVMTGALPPQPDVVPSSWPRLFEDLERFRPALIVDATGASYFNESLFAVEKFPRLESYLRERYDVVERPDGYVIYARRAP
jgi:4-amino-4-deoxy-L-arabinose transferase-like glycosyltransferase